MRSNVRDPGGGEEMTDPDGICGSSEGSFGRKGV